MRIYKHKNMLYIEHIKVNQGKIILPKILQEELEGSEVNLVIITKN